MSWSWGGGALVGPEWRDDLAGAMRAARDARGGALPPLLVFDLVHWDAAFSTYFRFAREVEALAAALAAEAGVPTPPLAPNATVAAAATPSAPMPGAHGWAAAEANARTSAESLGASPPPPLLVYRTPSFFAGQDTGNLRKFTSLRLELFHEKALATLSRRARRAAARVGRLCSRRGARAERKRSHFGPVLERARARRGRRHTKPGAAQRALQLRLRPLE
jgi:hypothetical protein